MYYGLYMSAAGANAQSQKVEVLSNNLANGSTAGFKRELALLEARQSEAIERGQAGRGNGSLNDVGGGTRTYATATDFSPGTMRVTNTQTDMAIEEPDVFFQVQRGGQRLLTRAGNFHFSPEGVLQTEHNDAVLSANGDAIQLNPQLPWQLLNGAVVAQGSDTAALGLARPKNLSLLEKVGENYFRAPGRDAEPAPPESRRVRSGYLELSAVNPVEEMVELIAASRAYEANVRVIQQHDTATSELISRLLRVS
jgi:flagellar basal-body rod protein FlgF/flagellar basal-body rod protein FlgG